MPTSNLSDLWLSWMGMSYLWILGAVILFALRKSSLAHDAVVD